MENQLYALASALRSVVNPTNYYALQRLRFLGFKLGKAWQLYIHYYPIKIRERKKLALVRSQQEHLYSDSSETPLVSVVIPTYNRGQLLAERTLPSVIAQTYQHFEVLVVGDQCTDNTGELIARIGDDRIRFVNLPERGNYPQDMLHLWQVAGAHPLNYAFQNVQGRWIAQLDDDEVFTPDHIEVLLHHAKAHNCEIVSGLEHREKKPDQWYLRGYPQEPDYLNFRSKYIHARSATLARSYLFSVFNMDMNCWRHNVAVDRDWSWRLYQAGVRTGFVDKTVLIAPLRPDQIEQVTTGYLLVARRK
jgi:glycosyltransferase involved in cell wall biosynthesis